MNVHIDEVKMRRIKRIQLILFGIITIWGILMICLLPVEVAERPIIPLGWLFTVIITVGVLGRFYDRLYRRNKKRLDDLYYEKLYDLEVRKSDERQKRQMQA